MRRGVSYTVEVMTSTRRPSLGAFSLVLAIGSGCGNTDGPPADESGDSSAAGSATTPSESSATAPSTDSADSTSVTESASVSDTAEDTTDTDPTDTGDPPVGECGAFPTFEDGLAPTAEIHVATNGSDGDGCGAEGSPCATVEGALANASPGTAIRIHSGTYAGGAYVSGVAGTADAPIWIGGAPGEDRPVFEGGGTAFQFSAVRYLVIHDLEVRNMTDNGINIDDGGAVDDPEATRGIVLRGLFVHDIGSGNNDCLKLSGVNEFVITGSEFTVCGGSMSGSGIDHVGCHQGVVAFNHFHDMPESGNAVQTKGGSADIQIHGNLFERAGYRAVNMGGSTGFEFFRPPLDPAGVNAEASDIRTTANVFVGGDAQVAFVGCTGCLAANNTMIDAEHWVMRVLQETVSTGEYMFAPSGNNSVVNNVVVFSRAVVGVVINIGGDTAPETFTFANNLWFASDAPDQSDPQLPAAENGGIVGVDPALAADYSIDAGSPAAGAGIVVEDAHGDHTGECWGEPPSIGAFEVAG